MFSVTPETNAFDRIISLCSGQSVYEAVICDVSTQRGGDRMSGDRVLYVNRA